MKKTLLTVALCLTSLASFAAVASPSPSRSVASHAAGGFPFQLEPEIDAFEGTVADAISVPGYTYMLVDVGSERRWVVSLAKPVVKGADVSVRSFGTQRDFKSRKLQRAFAKLWFAVVTVH